MNANKLALDAIQSDSSDLSAAIFDAVDRLDAAVQLMGDDICANMLTMPENRVADAGQLMAVAAGAAQIVSEIWTKAAELRGLNNAALHVIGPEGEDETDDQQPQPEVAS